jgi:hypothetical protein
MDQAIVLTRAGHYFDAGNGSCSAATVCHVWSETVVNLQVLNGNGDAVSRTSVAVNATPAVEDTSNSFHLSRDCPWGR